jgi:hypothetical protein
LSCPNSKSSDITAVVTAICPGGYSLYLLCDKTRKNVLRNRRFVGPDTVYDSQQLSYIKYDHSVSQEELGSQKCLEVF